MVQIRDALAEQVEHFDELGADLRMSPDLRHRLGETRGRFQLVSDETSMRWSRCSRGLRSSKDGGGSPREKPRVGLEPFVVVDVQQSPDRAQEPGLLRALPAQWADPASRRIADQLWPAL